MPVALYTYVVNHDFARVLVKNDTDKSIKLPPKLRLGIV